MQLHICRVASGRYNKYIEGSYALKEHKEIDDKAAFLLVWMDRVGDSYGFATWYKMDPDREVEKILQGAPGALGQGCCERRGL